MPISADADLLLALRDVSDLVSNSHDLAETMRNIVGLIQRRFRSDVCSVYVAEQSSSELTLAATVGLSPDSVGKLKMPIGQGLVGRAAATREPINLSDAAADPNFLFFEGSGEEAFRSFLGVPLVTGGAVQGVLVVQHREAIQYPPNQVLLLTGIAAQLATLVTNARLNRALADLVHGGATPALAPPATKPVAIHGVCARPGCAHGRALRFEAFDFADAALVARAPGDVTHERELLREAITRGRADLTNAAEHLAELLGEQFGAMMHTQRLMLEDNTVQRELFRLVEEGASVESAVVQVCREYLKAFEKLDNPFFYERIYDIKDVFRRVLDHALPGSRRDGGGDAVIVVAHEVSLLELFAADISRIRGIVVEKGGAYSHVAILARSLSIPMLTQAKDAVKAVNDGDDLYLDADSGVLAINPDEPRRQVFEKLLAEAAAPKPAEPEVVVRPPIRIEGTVNLLPEVTRSIRNGAMGIGLYRSEFLQLARRSVPTEEEQYDIYRKMIRLLDGRPLTIRTLDLRADKMLAFQMEGKAADVWEWRLVEHAPQVRDLIRVQLRAILRAAVDGPVKILFPMVVGDRQFETALRLVDDAKRSLRKEGLAFHDATPIGVMVEVAAAVLMLKHWIGRIDFVGVGSNDLLHSLLGIERSEDSLAILKTPLEPTYLRAVRHVVKQARAHGKEVTVCGEAASHPKGALALAAIGVAAISVPPDDLPRVRAQFAKRAIPADLENLGRRLVAAKDVPTIEAMLDAEFKLLG
ncbi:MAG TPA: putative PEP-binding protein [Planctomycetia bacterium]|nr:putative PEP-binding protein [Planctomycetia bacterium]